MSFVDVNQTSIRNIDRWLSKATPQSSTKAPPGPVSKTTDEETQPASDSQLRRSMSSSSGLSTPGLKSPTSLLSPSPTPAANGHDVFWLNHIL